MRRRKAQQTLQCLWRHLGAGGHTQRTRTLPDQETSTASHTQERHRPGRGTLTEAGQSGGQLGGGGGKKEQVQLELCRACVFILAMGGHGRPSGDKWHSKIEVMGPLLGEEDRGDAGRGPVDGRQLRQWPAVPGREGGRAAWRGGSLAQAPRPSGLAGR